MRAGEPWLIRSLVSLLDEWTPVIAGSELNEHPLHPITPASRRQREQAGDDQPVGWLHRDLRYGEKLATPDTSVGDLIGDVDPIRVAQGRTLGDPETIHFGSVAHRSTCTCWARMVGCAGSSTPSPGAAVVRFSHRRPKTSAGTSFPTICGPAVASVAAG